MRQAAELAEAGDLAGAAVLQRTIASLMRSPSTARKRRAKVREESTKVVSLDQRRRK